MSFQVGEYTYTIARKMDAFTQGDVFAMISPLLMAGFGELVPILSEMNQNNLKLAELPINKLGIIGTPVSVQLKNMSSADRRFIFATCLNCCDRKKTSDQTGWSPIWSVDANRPMYEDINSDIWVMLRITLGVVQETFSGFFLAPLLSLIVGGKT